MMVAVCARRFHARDLPGDEAAALRELTEPVIRDAGLVGQPESGPARVAQRPDEYGRQYGGSTSWPIASVIDRCSVSRSRAKSNVSPPTSPAGSSHAASVN